MQEFIFSVNLAFNTFCKISPNIYETMYKMEADFYIKYYATTKIVNG